MNAQAPMLQDPQVIVSNAFGRFILRLAAAEAGRRGALAAYITAAYPAERLARMMRGTGLDRFPAIAGFLADRTNSLFPNADPMRDRCGCWLPAALVAARGGGTFPPVRVRVCLYRGLFRGVV